VYAGRGKGKKKENLRQSKTTRQRLEIDIADKTNAKTTFGRSEIFERLETFTAETKYTSLCLGTFCNDVG
jgi:hypothetical protein